MVDVVNEYNFLFSDSSFDSVSIYAQGAAHLKDDTEASAQQAAL